MVTLLHFTHPLWLEDKGGFENEEAIAAFLAFARRVYREFGGKVGRGVGGRRTETSSRSVKSNRRLMIFERAFGFK